MLIFKRLHLRTVECAVYLHRNRRRGAPLVFTAGLLLATCVGPPAVCVLGLRLMGAPSGLSTYVVAGALACCLLVVAWLGIAAAWGLEWRARGSSSELAIRGDGDVENNYDVPSITDDAISPSRHAVDHARGRSHPRESGDRRGGAERLGLDRMGRWARP